MVEDVVVLDTVDEVLAEVMVDVLAEVVVVPPPPVPTLVVMGPFSM